VLRIGSFCAKGETFGRDRERFLGPMESFHLPIFKEVHERLKGVVIDNRDWLKVVDFYDTKDSIYYFDPPYLDCHDMSYGAWDTQTFKILTDRIATLKGRWILSINKHDASVDFAAQYDSIEIPIKYSSRQGLGAKGDPALELLIWHPDLSCNVAESALHKDCTRIARDLQIEKSGG
jgi:DNA adenine methylase